MKKLSHLEPKPIWEYFEEICQVPRPSKKEEQILQFLENFAKKHDLEYRKDSAGNMVIDKPASAGMQHLKKVVLQSHIDMVGEKNKGTEHDFEKDPIQPYIDGDWVKADGTTLGADDGIGMAAQLAILASDEISHGPLECLFTVDEESGLTGAQALESGLFDGKILLNLDSEDWGELFIGCAGGTDTTAIFDFDRENVPDEHQGYHIQVTGLNGGHSGDEIHKGLGNAIKIVNRFLWNITDHYDVRISRFEGGRAHNAIPREAEAHITIHSEDVENIKKYFNAFEAAVKNELKVTEPGLKLTLEEANMPEYVIDEDTQHDMVNALYGCPHGVHAWSQEIEDLVETSTNLAAIKLQDNDAFQVTTSQRSSVDSAKDDIASMVESVFRLGNAKVDHSTGYPGWQPNTDSEIMKITRDSYQRLFDQEPEVKAIHAGLECGLFLQKYPHLDMISVGPTIKGAHTPEEAISIETTQKFWDLLLEVLLSIPGEEAPA